MSRVDEIINNYKHRSPGVRSKLKEMMNTGKLARTGKLVILPVDQGFEHGPARSFAPNPKGYDPLYHVELAIESGCNAYAAPLGFIEAAASEYPGQVPLILKVNNNNSLYSSPNPLSAITSGIEDALDLGCHGIGFTIYPGTAETNTGFEQLKFMIRSAHENGLAAVVWSYARGEQIAKEDETALDIIAYSAHIAAQMGADIIKVKPPTGRIGLKAAEQAYENIPKATLTERISHIIQSAFDGKRITIFSGGAAKGKEAVLDEIKEINSGGGFGSIIGRNSFQRSKSDALELLNDVMNIYKN
ncbi:MAG: class I fructose-bisphosphate aldolase [Candidatus Heimdallarchaeota archaeon]|nr:class I fructose-bisphosphate aldolase [Candidatus Heimdallarchaeota archaeon]